MTVPTGPVDAAGPQRPPGLLRNRLSLAGALVAVVSLVNIGFLLLADALAARPNPYVGIFAYMVMPAITGLGLLLIPIGMLLERRRRRRQAPGQVPPWPRLDLNSPAHRRFLAGLVGFTVLVLILSTVGSYQAYHFSDSVTFCGALCHEPMKPQYTAYEGSPHARVPCVECHVGQGATWYVRAKLTGIYQVYAVAADKYPRPIPSPIRSLRPARETCEQCHWPEKFWGEQLKTFTHFASDEQNTPRETRLLIKTGGGNPDIGLAAGIHWHMNIANEVVYIAEDPQRQTIPWMRAKDSQGRVTEYVLKDAAPTPEQIAGAEKRRMDCMDCHNRPSHIFEPPDRAVNDAMVARRIDRTLPFIKRQAVEVLAKEYPSLEAAREGIASDLDGFYLATYPALHAQRRPAIQAAIAEVQRLYETSVFPEMKTNWQTHPNNIGHLYYAGCFRCHDGQHVTADGRALPNDCEICHTVLEQREGGKVVARVGQPFAHPVDIGDLAAAPCASCHTGAGGL